MPFSISGLLLSLDTDIGQRVDIGRGMITVLIWKKACINLFITYFNIELKRTKLASHTHHEWKNMEKGMHCSIYKEVCYHVALFIKMLDILLSEFCPDICGTSVFTYGQNWRYHLWICDKCSLYMIIKKYVIC